MIKKNFPLDRKYLYVNTELGCDMISTSGEQYHIPAGYFVFLVDEVKDFFTTSYCDFVYNDFDVLEVETRDFLIQNVQTPFDLNVNSFVRTITGIDRSLNAIEDYCRIMQNSVSMILNSTLQQNPISNVGALNLKSYDGPNHYIAYVPVMNKTFGGVLILSFSNKLNTSVNSSNVYTFDTFYSPYVGFGFDYDNGHVSILAKGSSLVSRDIRVSVSDSDGKFYDSVVFGTPRLKRYSLSGSVVNVGSDSFPFSNDGNYGSSLDLTLSGLFSVESNLTGVSMKGNDIEYRSEGYQASSKSGQSVYYGVQDIVMEIPFTVVVTPPVSASIPE